MNETKKKLIVLMFPLTGILIFDFHTMIQSFSSSETWRIIFSVTGFAAFFILTTAYVYNLNKRIKKQ
ncbi:MAG: hypothetical protein JXA53_10070 [Bacteroidales bacterium]|nr:hypothetical protein [Bacteroidales bacterium]